MSQTPVFSLAYTTVRAGAIRSVVNNWVGLASRPDLVEVVVSVDAGDAACLEAAKATADAFKGVCAFKVVVNDGAKNCVAGWNCAAAQTTGKVIIAVADDFAPPSQWDSRLIYLKPEGWFDGEFVVHVEDGYVHNIFVLAILTRKRYERFGYLFYPRYQSMFSDTEFTEVAIRDNVVIDARHLLFEHLHPDCNKRPRDGHDLHHASASRWNTGEQLFKFRQMQGFPLDDGPKATTCANTETAAGKNAEFVVYMQLTADDFSLKEVCLRLHEEGVNVFFWCHPTEYWCGEPLEPENRPAMDRIAVELRAAGLTVHQKDFKVGVYRNAGDMSVVVETRLRNAALQWIRSSGYENILVVDGDELWLKGTLDLVRSAVEQGHKAISTQMTPVAGCPGYPIERAQDLAVVYVGPGVEFKACRTPHVRQTVIPVPRIIHFTSTRKTMEETIAKHRRSGHYDDPDYDFEYWIANVLPNLKAGYVHTFPNGHKGVHMYTKYQIWPSTRAFFPNEWAEIPDSLKPFLGAPV